MMKISFVQGEDQHTFVGSGSHFRDSQYRKYEITGNWSPQSVDEQITVELKITYGPEDWRNTDLFGLFDSEENSLRGTMVAPVSQLRGEFVFKRDPEFVRFYPSPSFTNARTRWDFATTSVLDRLRRQTWSIKRIYGLISDGKRFVELTLRDNHYGLDLSAEEEEELVTLFQRLHEADVRFYASLLKIRISKAPAFM